MLKGSESTDQQHDQQHPQQQPQQYPLWSQLAHGQHRTELHPVGKQPFLYSLTIIFVWSIAVYGEGHFIRFLIK